MNFFFLLLLYELKCVFIIVINAVWAQKGKYHTTKKAFITFKNCIEVQKSTE